MDISSSYVRKRPGSRMLWFRIAVPGAQRAQFGGPEISFSLKTADLCEAKKKALHLAEKYQGEFARARREACRRCLDAEAVDMLVVEMAQRLCDIYEQALDCADMSPAEYFDRWRQSESHRDFFGDLLCEFDFKPDLGNEGWARLRRPSRRRNPLPFRLCRRRRRGRGERQCGNLDQ